MLRAEILIHKGNTSLYVGKCIFRTGTALIVLVLNISGIMKQCTDNSQRNVFFAEGLTGKDRPVHQSNGGKHGVGGVFQIVIFGYAFSIARVFTAEEPEKDRE